MKILSFSNYMKKQTLSEKGEKLENQLSMDLYSGDLEYGQKKIDILVNAVKSWFIIQFESELSKYNHKGKHMLDLLNLSTYELLDIYNENGIINDFNRCIDRKLFKEYENNFGFKQKIHECVLYKILEDKERIDYSLVFCKTFDLKLELAMKYIKKEDLNDTEIIQKYVDNGGNLNISFYPNYFNKDLKNNLKERFYADNLGNRLSELNEFKRRVKIA